MILFILYLLSILSVQAKQFTFTGNNCAQINQYTCSAQEIFYNQPESNVPDTNLRWKNLNSAAEEKSTNGIKEIQINEVYTTLEKIEQIEEEIIQQTEELEDNKIYPWLEFLGYLIKKLGYASIEASSIIYYAVSEQNNCRSESSNSEFWELKIWLKNAGCEMQSGIKYLGNTAKPWAQKIGSTAKKVTWNIFNAILKQFTPDEELQISKDIGRPVLLENQSGIQYLGNMAKKWAQKIGSTAKAATWNLYSVITDYYNSKTKTEGSKIDEAKVFLENVYSKMLTVTNYLGNTAKPWAQKIGSTATEATWNIFNAILKQLTPDEELQISKDVGRPVLLENQSGIQYLGNMAKKWAQNIVSSTATVTKSVFNIIFSQKDTAKNSEDGNLVGVLSYLKAKVQKVEEESWVSKTLSTTKTMGTAMYENLKYLVTGPPPKTKTWSSKIFEYVW